MSIWSTNASGLAMASILNQYDGFVNWRLVIFQSPTCSIAEQSHDTCDWELLAMVHSMKQCRHNHEGVNHLVLIQCDYRNLQYWQISKVLSRREARWAKILSLYHFVMEHQEHKNNPVNGPSKRPHYEIGSHNLTAILLPSITVTTITKSYGDLLPEIKTAQDTRFSPQKYVQP